MIELQTIYIRVPRNLPLNAESTQTLLSTLTGIENVTRLQRWKGKEPQRLSLEFISSNQQIRFAITASSELIPFVEAQIQSTYPLSIIERAKEDPIANVNLEVVELDLRKGPFYPIATSSAFKDLDPMSSVLSILSKTIEGEVAIVQFALEGIGSSWQKQGQMFADQGSKKEDGSYSPRGDAAIIKEKILHPGFGVSIRIASTNKATVSALISSLGVYTRSDGNSFGKRKRRFLDMGDPKKDLVSRTVRYGTILNIIELASLWHLPGDKVLIQSIVWGHAIFSEPPDNLPIATNKTEEEKADINFFGKTMFKNREQIFGIKTIDRFRHIWLVGKTGTGKSTLISNMVIDDIRKGRGVGVIDPHGELCETILNYIPSNRINDVVYFNPADREYPMILNPLQVTNKEEAELVVSGIVSVFNKIFGFSWGPRLEYILRNVLLSLAAIPDTTLANVITALTNPAYRAWMIDQLKKDSKDQVLISFWENEFNKMQDKQREEAVAPILNKVGQFVTSPLIRRIVGQPHSSMSIDDVMNDGKIILCNLSQGRLGEDNAALIGAMLITKFQLGAMRRVDIPEKDRTNFFLFVDEFQNFATPSFMKILSEARKYRLSLMLANQYMAQIPEEVQKSILGNAGTLISFYIGAEDAAVIYKEFGGVFTEKDFTELKNRQIALKLMIDGHASRAFVASTLPPPESKNGNMETILKVSRERYAKKLEKMEDATAPLPDLTEYESKAKQQAPKKPWQGGGGYSGGGGGGQGGQWGGNRGGGGYNNQGGGDNGPRRDFRPQYGSGQGGGGQRQFNQQQNHGNQPHHHSNTQQPNPIREPHTPPVAPNPPVDTIKPSQN